MFWASFLVQVGDTVLAKYVGIASKGKGSGKYYIEVRAHLSKHRGATGHGIQMHPMTSVLATIADFACENLQAAKHKSPDTVTTGMGFELLMLCIAAHN